MPTAKKPTSTSKAFGRAATAAAKAAAAAVPATAGQGERWRDGAVTSGGSVAATIAALRRTRGPNKAPTKEQVAIRLDREVVGAFRAGGPGWQTRMNAALKDWLAAHPARPGRKARDAAG